MLFKHKETTKNHGLAHSYEILQKSKMLREIQKLVVGMHDLMFDHTQEEAKRANTLANTIEAKSAIISTLTKRYESNRKQMIDWKIKFNALKENLDITSVDALSEEIEHWKETAEEMRESYEESIHFLTPRAIEKSWINNLNKKVRLFSLMLSCCV